MPIKLSDIENNLDFEVKNPNVVVLIPGPKLQAKKSTAQLLLYFFITYKDISTINKELFKIIYDRVHKENDFTTLNFFFNCLSNYDFEREDTIVLLISTINRLDIRFFDYADVFHFANTEFPELNLFELKSRTDFGLLNKEECIQTIKITLQNLQRWEKNDRITAPTRNWRFSGLMKFCASYQVQWWQTVKCFEIANFL